MKAGRQKQRARARERQFFPDQTPGQRPRGSSFLAGRGMSMQPEGFQHALAERRGLRYASGMNPYIPGRRLVGVTPGYYRQGEGPSGMFGRPRTVLSGRIRRQKLDEDAVALEPETAQMEATQARYTTPAPTRRTGLNPRRRSSLAGNETMLGGRSVLG
jgi:hypothetical protein